MVNVSDDVYNTQHGNYPGHERLEEYPHAPKDKPLYSKKRARSCNPRWPHIQRSISMGLSSLNCAK